MTARFNSKRENTEQIVLEYQVDRIYYSIEQLRLSQGVKSVTIRAFFVSKLTEGNANRLWKAIGDLPNLESLTIWFGGYPFAVAALTDILSRAKKLTHLTFGTVDLGADVKGFAKVLTNHPSLVEVDSSGLHLVDGTSLDPFLIALSTVPNLEKVRISMGHRQMVSWSDVALIQLCRSNNLRELKLVRTDFTDATFGAIMRTVRSNRTLTSLELFSPNASSGVLSSDSWDSLCDMLRSNTVLKRLILSKMSDMNDDACVSMAKSLEENSSLKELYILGNQRLLRAKHRINGRGYAALVNMLQKNSTLEQLLTEADEQWKQRMDFYLKFESIGSP